MLSLTFVSITAGGQSAWSVAAPNPGTGGGLEELPAGPAPVTPADSLKPNPTPIRDDNEICDPVVCLDSKRGIFAGVDGVSNLQELKQGTDPIIKEAATLTLSKTGNGIITSTPAGISCDTDCIEDYALNTPVTSTATLTDGSKSVSWEGACTGTNETITVTMDAVKACAATFSTFTKEELAIQVAIIGILADVAIPSYTDYMTKQKVLEALQLAGGLKTPIEELLYSYGSWPTDITQLTDKISGKYTEKVWLEPFAVKAQLKADLCPGIAGKAVTLAYDSSTQLWTRSAVDINDKYLPTTCAGGQKTEAALNVNCGSLPLTTTKTGNGTVTGTVPTNSTAIINCGADCSEDFVWSAQPTIVTLNAVPDVGLVFKEWSGNCSGTNATTTVTMDAAKSCTANFVLESVTEIPAPVIGILAAVAIPTYTDYLKRSKTSEAVQLVGGSKEPGDEGGFWKQLWDWTKEKINKLVDALIEALAKQIVNQAKFTIQTGQTITTTVPMTYPSHTNRKNDDFCRDLAGQ